MWWTLTTALLDSSNAAYHIGPISESDIFTWEALIMGPKDTPFEGGVFAAKLTFVSIVLNSTGV